MTAARTDAPRTEKRLFGYLVEFLDPEHLIEACRRVRDAGYRRWDAHTPFPLHAMDDAMGIRGTRLPWIVLAAGLTGCALALLLQWYTNAFDYPYAISGKPFFSLPAFVPVTFELTILLSALATFFAMWSLNGLPRLHHPLFNSARFRRVTADRFFIVIEASDPLFDHERTRAFLEGLGGTTVEPVEE
jgi:hypothetical protein